MPRTTAEKVGNIVDVDDEDVIADFIAFASDLVDEVCVPPQVYTETRLEFIERYLAAHFYTISRPQVASSTAGPVQETNEPLKIGEGLKLTKYGQSALRFDTGGYLAAMDNAMEEVKKPLPGAGRKKTITWLGTTDDTSPVE